MIESSVIPIKNPPKKDFTKGTPACKILYIWSMLNFVVIFTLQFNVPFIYSIPNQVMLISSLLNLLLLHYAFQIPFKINSLIIGLLMLQIWLVISTIHSDLTIPREDTNSISILNFTWNTIFYLLSICVGTQFPEMLPKIRKLIIIGGVISLIFAFLQFVNFAPAIKYANDTMFGGKDISNWDGRGGIRTAGLNISPVQFAGNSLLCAIFFITSLKTKDLKLSELILTICFFAGAIAAQVRAIYPTVIVCFIYFIYLLIKRKNKKSYSYIAITFLSMILFMGLNSTKLAYGLSSERNNDSLDFRTELAWAQARNIAKKRPWTGVGIDMHFQTYSGKSANQWYNGNVVDNSYLLLVSWGGYPAVLILIFTVIFSAIGLKKYLTYYQIPQANQEFGIAALFLILFYAIFMITTDAITSKELFTALFIGGLATPINKLLPRPKKNKQRVNRFKSIQKPLGKFI